MLRMARSVSLACVLAGASAARAEGLSALIAPGVSTSRTSRTDAEGRTTEEDVTDVTQQYTLSIDRKLYPNVGFSGTGLIAKDLSWTRDAAGTTRHGDDTAATVSTRLTFGTALLGGALSYDRRQELVPLASGRGWAVGETWAATAGWHPLDLPTLDLRVSRSDAHDPAQPGDDAATSDAQVALGYVAIRGLDLRYTLRFTDARRLSSETTSVGQDARASYRTTLLDGRTNAYLSAGVSSLWSDTTSSDPNGAVLTQKFPVAGLSLVEDFPAIPENDLLSPNPGLVNGDVRSPAAVNLGFSVGPADLRPRDLGVQLPDVVTKVNRIRVWVDRALPPAVSGAFPWDVYRSDDGQHWTTVPRAGPVSFATIENRFEIPIAETAARYLKVVTRPLDAAVTTDARFRDVWVTEVQIFEVVLAAQLRGTTARVTETFSGTAQTRLLASPNLSHDISIAVTHPSEGAPTTWLLVNGLSVSQRPRPTLTLSARVARQDSDSGSGHVGAFQWSGTAAHQPLPTLSEGLTYSGQVTQARGRNDLSNAIAGYTRAELYTGVAATGNASYAITSSSGGTVSRSAATTVGASLTPNRVLGLAGTYGVSATRSSGGSAPESSSTRQRADATATFAPVPALYATAGLSRSFGDGRPSTIAHGGLNLSPFPDGQLLARLTYSDSLDTATDSRTRLVSPTLRWTVRAGVFLDLAYTDIRSEAPVEATRIRTASANLTIAL